MTAPQTPVASPVYFRDVTCPMIGAQTLVEEIKSEFRALAAPGTEPTWNVTVTDLGDGLASVTVEAF